MHDPRAERASPLELTTPQQAACNRDDAAGYGFDMLRLHGQIIDLADRTYCLELPLSGVIDRSPAAIKS